MLVFRKRTRESSGEQLRRELEAALPEDARCDATEALLRAGEIECALADAGGPELSIAMQLTDALAACFVRGAAFDRARCLRLLARVPLPRQLSLRTPEGFAYYALLPRQYVELAQRVDARAALVIGIRSIGTSLGALVRAALQARNVDTARISVRPEGHPWDRRVTWSEDQLAIIHQQLAAGACFAVVDEGPGLSGSSFLAVAAALEGCGVSPGHIHLCCSHAPDPQRLFAPHAAERWSRYRVHPIKVSAPQARALSPAIWREHCYGIAAEWPAVWSALERIKLLSADGRWLDKFEGLPPYGSAPYARAELLAAAGHGPSVSALSDGFARYPFVAGRAGSERDLDEALLDELARYCTFRTRAFAVGNADPSALAEMLRVNALEGLTADVGARVSLAVEQPIVADARMQPHKWRRDRSGRWTKLDGNADGDAHLLPGPCDVCWDLAGAIVEWRMPDAAADRFIARFERLAGTRVRARLAGYRAAYCAQRMGEMAFAAKSDDGAERMRAQAAHLHYRHALASVLRALAVPTPLPEDERDAWSQ